MGQSVNKKTLSEVFGISEPTFTKYQKQGLPFMRGRSKGNSNTYDTEDVFRWLISKERSVRLRENEYCRHRNSTVVYITYITNGYFKHIHTWNIRINIRC